MVLLKIRFFRDVTPCRLVNSHRRLGLKDRLHISCQSGQEECGLKHTPPKRQQNSSTHQKTLFSIHQAGYSSYFNLRVTDPGFEDYILLGLDWFTKFLRLVQPSTADLSSQTKTASYRRGNYYLAIRQGAKFGFVVLHLGIILVNNQLDEQFFLYMFILYMFRATMCSSSGESIVSIRHLVYGTLCR